MTGSAGQRRVPADFIRRYRTALPPLFEQRRIASILDQADELRRKRQESLELLASLDQAVFIDWFGRCAQEQFDIAKLGSLCDVQGGLQVSTARAHLPIEAPYLRVANVQRDRLDLREIKTIRAMAAELERVRLLEGDVLVVEGHGNPGEIGRAAVWSGQVKNCVHQNHLIRVRPVHRILPVYLSAFLNSRQGRRQLIRSGKTTSGLNTISTSNVKGVDVPVPPIHLQRRFVAAVELRQEAGARAEVAAGLAEALFGALARKVFAAT